MAWDWLDDVAIQSLDLVVPSSGEVSPSDPLRVQLWTLGGVVVLASAGALAALFLFPPVPPAGFFDVSIDAMTRGRTVGLVGGVCGGAVLGAILGRLVGLRADA